MPMYGLQIAFKDFKIRDGILGSSFVGLKHFARLFTHPDGRQVIINTLIISINTLIWTFPAPVILSLLLNELNGKVFKRTVQSILYLPHFISWAVINGLMFGFFSITSGMVNKVLVSLGLPAVNFLSNPATFRQLLYLTSIWKGAGWGTIIYMAAISGIDPTLYEAAIIDGAGRIRRMLSITLPMISFTIVTLLILNVGNVMSSNFDQIYNLISPAVYSVGQTIDVFVYEQGINKMNYSFTTAIGLFQQVINFMLLLATNKIVRMMGSEGFL
ncbi:MAG: ABC transporter permease subunit [Spirochaetaceae bacterium]|nr:ABC transporter permease subunit [Spirochaetaceae bacterium]